MGSLRTLGPEKTPGMRSGVGCEGIENWRELRGWNFAMGHVHEPGCRARWKIRGCTRGLGFGGSARKKSATEQRGTDHTKARNRKEAEPVLALPRFVDEEYRNCKKGGLIEQQGISLSHHQECQRF